MTVRNSLMVGALAATLLVGAGPASATTLDPNVPDHADGVDSLLSQEQEAAAADDLAQVAAQAAAIDPVLSAGETLAPGEALVSPSGRYATVLTAEGALLVVLQPTRFNPEPVIVAVLGVGEAGAELRLQGDGNLVMYNPDGSVAVNFGTDGSGATQLVMQDDRNLVLYGDNRVVINFDTRTLAYLVPGQALLSGDQLVAEDGSSLVMQTDGNLVLYKDGQVRFQSGTRSEANNGADAVLQTDGNFVVYAGDRPVFNTGTQTSIEAANVLVLEEGQFSILGGSHTFGSVYGSAWNSPTVTPGQSMLRGDRRRSADGRSVLQFQADGNLVQYRDGRVVFQTRTRGDEAVVAVMQTDGNFVLYGVQDTEGPESPLRALFHTRTNGNPGASLVVPDGFSSVQVRSTSGRVLFPR